ncbi:unnamed protein product [Caenorhabditis bovis]|uniref:non-specific serine/threonine protein kinase n=1 Tax=Caenorhabditis bovis TaxID=2654633 RepID=A0A8S1F1E4_9PELO|nr:unnamed protein product [Caenorhabditis bovis]
MERIRKWEQNCAVLRESKFRTKYQIESEIIGEGSFGTVLNAKCRASQEQRAVKAIRRIEKVSMLSIELQLLAELGGHFNIVRFYDFFHVLGSVAIVMEYFPHCTVSELLMYARSDANFSLLYFKNLLIALSYLHMNHFVHRDIKLSNFLYSPAQNSFRLVDFGLATIDRSDTEISREAAIKSFGNHAECENCRRQSSACILCKGKPRRDHYHMVGTPGARAPEMLFGVGITSSPVDIFSAGLCLLSLVGLKHPLFMPKDETENIMNLACLLGSKTLEDVAALEGIAVTISEFRPPVDFCRFILMLRFGFNMVNDFSNLIPFVNCQMCAENSADNDAGNCFCRPAFDEKRFRTDGVHSDLLILYSDLLYLALEPDRKKRYNANQLLAIIDLYEKRAEFVPRPFSNQDE